MVHRCVILRRYSLDWCAAYIVRPADFFGDERDGVIASTRTAAAGVMYTRAVVDVLTRRWCDYIMIIFYYCGDNKCVCLYRVTVVRNVQYSMYNIQYAIYYTVTVYCSVSPQEYNMRLRRCCSGDGGLVRTCSSSRRAAAPQL